jgi:AcrR family transcriptional regulator
MDTRESLLAHALALLERDGIAAFSTRNVCNLAQVTAPTLYHHFGSADGLLSAAVTRGFEEFLARKTARNPRDDAAADLLDGWDDYVAFARERPRLYAAMTARLLSGADIPAATEARQHLIAKLEALEAAHSLALPVAAAAEILWSTAHAASLLHVAGTGPPDAAAIQALRRTAASVLSANSR